MYVVVSCPLPSVYGLGSRIFESPFCLHFSMLRGVGLRTRIPSSEKKLPIQKMQ